MENILSHLWVSCKHTQFLPILWTVMSCFFSLLSLKEKKIRNIFLNTNYYVVLLKKIQHTLHFFFLLQNQHIFISWSNSILPLPAIKKFEIKNTYRALQQLLLPPWSIHTQTHTVHSSLIPSVTNVYSLPLGVPQWAPPPDIAQGPFYKPGNLQMTNVHITSEKKAGNSPD